jgi:hypothetical protein
MDVVSVESQLRSNRVLYEVKSDGTSAIVGPGTTLSRWLVFRRAVEVNGQKSYVTSISGFKGWGALIGIESVSVCSGNQFFVVEGDFVISKDKKKLIQYLGCSSRIVVPKSIELIGEYCFSRCESLNEAIFESGCNLKRIEKWAFRFSGLNSIRIPSKVEFIGEYCFSRCRSLTEVIFEGEAVISPDAFFDSPVEVVKVPAGGKLNYIRHRL